MPRLRVLAHSGDLTSAPYEFDRDFRIGRSAECEVRIDDNHVSRVHMAIKREEDAWVARDLGSSNGIFVDDQRVRMIRVDGTVELRLGIAGPKVSLEVIPDAAVPAAPGQDALEGETQWLRRHLDETPQEGAAGEQTMMIRRALKRLERRQRWRYAAVAGLLAVVAAAAALYTLRLQRQVGRDRQAAEDLFYAIKSLDLDIAKAEQAISNAGNPQALDVVRGYQRKRERLNDDYNRFLTAVNIYDARLNPKEKLILRVARIFGESEIGMPSGFVDEVQRYISIWQSSGRFRRAVALAKKNGYDQFIGREFFSQDLPPQFFYLAMQESDFDPYTSGPPTRKGIAKGMWQFIPETAVQYGLKIGPLADVRRADPADERDHFEVATKAAARYIKDLYTTDAQASGLLVMACYNWGDNRVIPLVQSMPKNPRDRNFWKFLEKFRSRTPEETYNYVFNIVAAAVIGEDPRLFGFDFDNPLADIRGR